MEYSQGQKDHAERARRLIENFGTKELLAEFLHQGYRATAKSLARHHGIRKQPLLHDHGWGDCSGACRRYFLRRAAWLMTAYPHQNGRLGRRAS